MEKLIAAKLYLENKNIDTKLLILKILNLVEKTDLSKVIEAYEKILANEIIPAHIVTSIELENSVKMSLERFINGKFQGQNIVFVYDFDKKVSKGISIKVGDNLITFPEINNLF